MPYGSIFPVAQLFTSPLAVDLTVAGGSTYKCIYSKMDATDELNAVNYEITILVKAATAAVLNDGDEVTIAGVTYYIEHRREEEPGLVRLFLTQAETDQEGPPVGSELFPAGLANFSSAFWQDYHGATTILNAATFPAEVGYTPPLAVYGNYVSLTEGETYQLTVVIDTLENGTVSITEDQQYNFSFFLTTPGTHVLYFEAKYYYMGYLRIAVHNSTATAVISSLSLKQVTG